MRTSSVLCMQVRDDTSLSACLIWGHYSFVNSKGQLWQQITEHASGPPCLSQAYHQHQRTKQNFGGFAFALRDAQETLCPALPAAERQHWGEGRLLAGASLRLLCLHGAREGSADPVACRGGSTACSGPASARAACLTASREAEKVTLCHYYCEKGNSNGSWVVGAARGVRPFGRRGFRRAGRGERAPLLASKLR